MPYICSSDRLYPSLWQSRNLNNESLWVIQIWEPKCELLTLTVKFDFLSGLVLARHNQYRYIYPSIHPLYLSPSFSVLSLLPACSINGFSCIIWVGILELMDWGGWHGFQSHSSCPVLFCKFPFSCINSTPLFLILSSAPSCLDSCPSCIVSLQDISVHCVGSNGTQLWGYDLLCCIWQIYNILKGLKSGHYTEKHW